MFRSSIIDVLFTAALTVYAATSFSSASSAGLIQSDCRAVDKIASVTYPSKLALAVVRDENAKSCHFSLELPPPYTMSKAVETWFKGPVYSATATQDLGKLSDVLVEKLLFDIVRDMIPKISPEYLKEIAGRFSDNSKLAYECVIALVKKSPGSIEASDGNFACQVPPQADYVQFEVMAAGRKFALVVALPRPV